MEAQLNRDWLPFFSLFLNRKCNGRHSDDGLHYGRSELHGETGNQVHFVFPPRLVAAGPEAWQRIAGQRRLLSGKSRQTGFITGRPFYSYGHKSEHQLSKVHLQRKCRWTLRRFQFAPEYIWMEMLRDKSKWNVNLVAPVSYYFAVVEGVNFRITEFQQISLKPDIHWFKGFSK